MKTTIGLWTLSNGCRIWFSARKNYRGASGSQTSIMKNNDFRPPTGNLLHRRRTTIPTTIQWFSSCTELILLGRLSHKTSKLRYIIDSCYSFKFDSCYLPNQICVGFPLFLLFIMLCFYSCSSNTYHSRISEIISNGYIIAYDFATGSFRFKMIGHPLLQMLFLEFEWLKDKSHSSSSD